METFLVERTDRYSYGEDYAMVVVAKDALHAERLARWKSHGFKKAKLKTTKVDMTEEAVILSANVGS